jgi:hypothetical protein
MQHRKVEVAGSQTIKKGPTNELSDWRLGMENHITDWLKQSQVLTMVTVILTLASQH